MFEIFSVAVVQLIRSYLLTNFSLLGISHALTKSLDDNDIVKLYYRTVVKEALYFVMLITLFTLIFGGNK